MDRLARQLWYLYVENGLYHFSAQPNLNRILVEREDAVRGEEIRRMLVELIGFRPFPHPYIWPAEDRDVHDTPELSLVVLDPDRPLGGEDEAASRRFISRILDNHGMTYREVIDPLIREGADLAIRVELAAQSEAGIRENTVELGIKESLYQRGVRPEIETE